MSGRARLDQTPLNTGPAGPPSPMARRAAHWRWQVSNYLFQFVEGDHAWGQIRLLAMGLVAVGAVFISRLFEPVGELPLYNWLVDQLFLRDFLPESLIGLGGLLASFFTRRVLRHAIPPLVGLGVALYFGGAYLRDLLELPNFQQALKYLTATLFGSNYPRMSINEGKPTLTNPEINPMLKIGGPGWVDIKIGNAALFERVVGPSSVLGAGTHFLRRFESLREAFDLREFERVKAEVRLVTKDGVPIVIQDMRVRFRVAARRFRTEANPYPVLKRAVRRAAYSRKVTAKGLEEWADVVTGSVRSIIAEWIAQQPMDELIPPPREGDDPEPAAPHRQAIHDRLRSKDNLERFASIGADILWVSIGHIRPDPDVDPDLKLDSDPTGHDKIHEQLIATWKATHAALAQDEVIHARAYARWLDDTARANAETDLILALTRDLRKAQQAGTPIDDDLVERLLNYVAGLGQGDSHRQEADIRKRLLAAASLLEGEPPKPPAEVSGA